MRERIILGNWSEEKLDDLLKESPPITNTGKRINFLSRQFLGVGYNKSTLTGDSTTPEIFVINLEKLDCFTFIDYIEAMRISGSFPEFMENLKKVRYKSGEIAYKNRNHFFTDWQVNNPDRINDVTAHAGAGKSMRAKKTLNMKDDGTCYLSGIPCTEREVVYIPAADIDDAVIEKLKTGDYIGIYSKKKGLDVSHVGVMIKERGKDKNKVILRHASSVKKKVIDEDFRRYIAGKPGVIVLRPKN